MLTPTRLAMSILPLLLLAGCPSKGPDKNADAGIDADLPPQGDASSVSVTVPLNPIGTTCSTNGDCASGFCADGVCCDSACGQTCFSCSTAGKVGNCAPLTSDQDLSAIIPCGG